MQSLEIISVNVWHIVISLCNLLLLFWILKRFLYQPVQTVMAQRQAAIAEQYERAQAAKDEAESMKAEWQDKMDAAQAQADDMVASAVKRAEAQSRELLDETRQKAARMVRHAEEQAAVERRKAEKDMKRHMADVSVAVAEKMLEREIHADDHSQWIDSFIAELGEDDESDE